MDYQLNTRLNGNIAMTSSYHERASLQRDKTLYKFIWVQSGTLTLEIDHIPMRLEKDEIVTLTPLHHLEVKEVDGEYLTFVFNSNFYCIYGHDNEVSCNGFLFYGSSKVMKLALSAGQSSNLHDIVRIFRQESVIHDNLQEDFTCHTAPPPVCMSTSAQPAAMASARKTASNALSSPVMVSPTKISRMELTNGIPGISSMMLPIMI